MRLIVEQDNKVYNLLDDRKGVVQSVYRELNIAVVKFDDSTEKVSLDNLVVLEDQDDNSGGNDNIITKLIHRGKKFIHRLKND